MSTLRSKELFIAAAIQQHVKQSGFMVTEWWYGPPNTAHSYFKVANQESVNFLIFGGFYTSYVQAPSEISEFWANSKGEIRFDVLEKTMCIKWLGLNPLDYTFKIRP